MKKELRFSFLVALAEKKALEILAEFDGESQASFIRRLIRQAASAHGLGKPEPGFSEGQKGESNE
jgi:hypothetical protein